MPSEYKYVNKEEILDFDKVYHIYNRSIGNELLFRKEKDYYFFLQKLERYILPIADIYAYCLMPNHFHLLIRTRIEEETLINLKKQSKKDGVKVLTQTFSNFFNSYSKSYNKVHKRMGRLFLYPFKRILVDKEDYLLTLVNYIHRNPIHHGFVKNYTEWKYSSFNAIIENKPSIVNRDLLLDYFTSVGDFIAFHEMKKVFKDSEKYFLE